MKLFKRILNKNTFIFKNGQVLPVTGGTDKNTQKSVEQSLLPIIIIAREHYQELEKEYPVPDRKEVRNIIDNEFRNLKMTYIDAKDLNTSKAKIFAFDSVSEAFIRQRFCVYIPETLLVQFLQERELTTVSRLGNSLNLIRKGNRVFSSSGMGLYQNPQLFLASSGVGEATSSVEYDQSRYFELILEHLMSLKSADFKTILSGQVAHLRLFESLHFPSLGLGALAAIFVYWGLLWGHLSWTEKYADSDFSNAEIRSAIQSKQTLEANLDLYKELISAQQSDTTGKTIWELITALLEANVSVSSMMYEDGELQISLLAPSATDAIKFVREHTTVESITVDGDIYNLQGKQGVRVLVLFKKELTNV